MFYIIIMTDKPTLSRAFNKDFLEFLEDILCIYPDSQEISKAKVSFETIKRANPALVIKAWYQNVYTTYRDVIDSGDISFFVDKDYSNDLQSVANAGEIIKMIENIRGPIRNMDESNKQHCMTYIQNLSKLSTVYNTM